MANSDIIFHIQFANPVSTDTPSYDGFYGVARHSITHSAADTTPTLTLSWDTNHVGTTTLDLNPQSDYDLTTDAAQWAVDSGVTNACAGTHSGNSGAEIWSLVDASDGADKMCTETWNIGSDAAACVVVTGFMKRTWAESADDAVCDFAFDYVSHTVKIQIGSYLQGSTSADLMRFSRDVDFQDFY